MENDNPGPRSLLLLPVVPALLALGLWLIGVPLDWSSWKTYAGLAIITLAIGVA